MTTFKLVKKMEDTIAQILTYCNLLADLVYKGKNYHFVQPHFDIFDPPLLTDLPTQQKVNNATIQNLCIYFHAMDMQS